MKTRPICYASFADKAQRYVRETLPAVLAAAADAPGHQVFDNWFRRNVSARALAEPLTRLKQLHDAVRAGRYVPELDARGNDLACDVVRYTETTIRAGGDCEDWAAVLLAGAAIVADGALLVTSGEPHDNFLHICVAALLGGRLYLLDPKGDEFGAPFNSRGESYSVVRYWTRGPGGKANEVHVAQGVLA